MFSVLELLFQGSCGKHRSRQQNIKIRAELQMEPLTVLFGLVLPAQQNPVEMKSNVCIWFESDAI